MEKPRAAGVVALLSVRLTYWYCRGFLAGAQRGFLDFGAA
jgi:hypothetical protein